MTASESIDEIIAGVADWRGGVLARVRAVIREGDPAVTEEVKWLGAVVWSHDGDVCAVTALKAKVKLTFPQGARLPNPAEFLNNGLEGRHWRAIDVFENDELNASSLRALLRASVEYNSDKAGASSAVGHRSPRRTASD